MIQIGCLLQVRECAIYDATHNIRKRAYILKMKDAEADEFVDSIEKGRRIEMLVEIKGFQPYDLEYIKMASKLKK